MDQKPIIAITTGDPCGVGAEITVKALGEEAVYAVARPLVISDARLIEQAIAICGSDLEVNAVHNPAEGKYTYGVIDVLDLKNFPLEDQKFGQVVKEAGRASYEFIEKAVQLALAGKIDGITTGPINKEAINLAGYHYAGHTEILADLTNTPKVCMMLTDGHMRVSHVTTHIPMAEVKDRITTERILDVIRLTHDALIKMNVEKPKIAVAGYNPHSGEGGLFGDEETKYIIPAIEQAVRENLDVKGPVSPDTVFVKMMGKLYDAVVAMYHDQGHIPIKLVGFKQKKDGTMSSMSGVNVTLGLPIIRTSVDHGTAFDKAGKGIASPESMLDALKLAALMASNK